MGMKLSRTEQNLVSRVAESWSREKDNAQRLGLECEIQYQLECSYGKAACLANEVRLRWGAR